MKSKKKKEMGLFFKQVKGVGLERYEVIICGEDDAVNVLGIYL